ncbi:hypothetical protein [Granulicella tundricola]|uniref:Uncharacterized protein n=1 Tax=Granulicella tundricola (strain ATCC BAA-1859 / DSM 23138 / MP5ACTX9) TaxID=1198114 RepID=E8WW25_GRATM|nr:hypothetical protein [Granulicella tundricola]ADW67331.1 hypothetical protein AciX9_0257 [Granulicella tundricola MP5ACTX9]
MTRTLSLLTATCLSAFALAASGQAPAAGPADGITMEMMPITADQISQCRGQATSQLASEQDTLHKREHGQDNDKMKQGAVTGITGAATSAISRKSGYGWWGGNNNGAQTAAATGATQRTDRNSDNVASTTAIGQQVGTDAYSQCVAGIKGPEYVHFRQTGQITAFTGSAPTAAPSPAIAAAAPVAPPPMAKAPVQDTGDGKHFILTAPGQTDAREVTLVTGSKNSYIEETTGDKYIVMPDGSVTRIAKRAAAKKS